ncbi:MAG TPA: CinA family protein, partial [Fluviicola sp.]|nr:CinA family protein [Fluviicola sp.]
SISGASNYFQGGLITYSNELKKELAFVKEETLRNFGAVSSEVVCEMALGGIERLNTDWSIAVSGIAGPTGGTEEKPVGTVWIAVANKKGVDAHQFLFGNDRGRTIQMTVLTALNLLRCKILEI